MCKLNNRVKQETILKILSGFKKDSLKSRMPFMTNAIEQMTIDLMNRTNNSLGAIFTYR